MCESLGTRPRLLGGSLVYILARYLEVKSLWVYGKPGTLEQADNKSGITGQTGNEPFFSSLVPAVPAFRVFHTPVLYE